MESDNLLQDLAKHVQVLICNQNEETQEKKKASMKTLTLHCGKFISVIFLLPGYLTKALQLTQKILTEGSIKLDFLGRPECRSFVLNENNDTDVNLFGSANIESWLHLHLTNKVGNLINFWF